jgi:hypothetical protein
MVFKHVTDILWIYSLLQGILTLCSPHAYSDVEFESRNRRDSKSWTFQQASLQIFNIIVNGIVVLGIDFCFLFLLRNTHTRA